VFPEIPPGHGRSPGLTLPPGPPRSRPLHYHYNGTRRRTGVRPSASIRFTHVAKDALYFLTPLVAAAAAAVWLGWTTAGLVLGVLAVYVVFFFRDPERTVPSGPGIIVAPADGRLVRIHPGPDGIEVSIFLSLFDVHVNRSPVEGRVSGVEYRKGSFHAAFSHLASAENEQNTLTIANDDLRVTCSQIAGIVARRIVCWKVPGDTVARGERIGLIRFGSRVDLVIPSSARLQVRTGEKVRAGASVIAIMETAS